MSSTQAIPYTFFRFISEPVFEVHPLNIFLILIVQVENVISQEIQPRSNLNETFFN